MKNVFSVLTVVMRYKMDGILGHRVSTDRAAQSAEFD